MSNFDTGNKVVPLKNSTNQSAFDMAIARCDAATSELLNQVAGLEDALARVLTPVRGDKESPFDEAVPESSQLVGWVNGHAIHIGVLAARLQRIRDRLEV